jgi:hypothetical protein
MLVPDDKPASVRTAEHYRQYRQQLARKGVTKPHAISTKIKGIQLPGAEAVKQVERYFLHPREAQGRSRNRSSEEEVAASPSARVLS